MNFISKKKANRWLIIPIETKVRELLAKSLLACFAVNRGFNVILGESQIVRDYISHLPAGIFCDKSLAPSRVEEFKRYRDYGHKVVAWCEEGLVFTNDEEYLRRKVAAGALQQVECFFAWGPYQAELIVGRFPEAKGRVLPFGNPRLDLLRAEFREVFRSDASLLREKHGRFILVNSNFSLCNHKDGTGAAIAKLRKSGKVNTAREEAFIQGWIDHKTRLMEFFVAMIYAVSKKYSDLKVIVRPHPSEDHDVWNDYFPTGQNIQVVHQGPVIPWIMASSVLIHNGCTTGIEAALLDQPVIAYQPVSSDVYDISLPNEVSHQIRTIDELIACLDCVLAKGTEKPALEYPNREDALSLYLSGLQNDKPSCEMIVDQLCRISGPEPKAINRRPWFFLHRFGLEIYLRMQISLNRALAGTKPRSAYELQKFPKLEEQELVDVCRLLTQKSNELGAVQVKQLADNLFMLSR